MYDVLAIVSIFLIFAALAACVELGVRAGHRRAAMHGAGAHAGLGAVEGAVFGLLGLLLALTFSAAATRFDLRRELIVREAEAIEAAYRRLDLLPEATQPELRALFGRYLDARLAFYSRPSEFQNPVAELERIDVLEGEIWTRAIAACRTAESHEVKLLVLPALNEMYKIAATRLMALRMHTPGLVFAVLIALSLICAMIGGYALSGGKGHRWMHLIGFAATLAVTIYVILDYEYPRMGLIRVDSFDSILIELRRTMP